MTLNTKGVKSIIKKRYFTMTITDTYPWCALTMDREAYNNKLNMAQKRLNAARQHMEDCEQTKTRYERQWIMMEHLGAPNEDIHKIVDLHAEISEEIKTTFWRIQEEVALVIKLKKRIADIELRLAAGEIK